MTDHMVRLELEVPQRILLFEDIFLFHDIFFSGDSIYFVQYAYPPDFCKRSEEVKEIRRSCKFFICDKNGAEKLEIIPQMVYRGFNQVLCYAGESLSSTDELCLKILWSLGERILTLRKIATVNRTGIVPTALFKDDALFTVPWIEYYNRMGISRFLLYYNAPLDSYDFNKLFSGLDLISPVDIKIIEWDYKYYAAEKQKNNREGPFAKLPFMVDAKFRISDAAKYILYIDIDEYVYLPPEHATLMKYVELYDRKDAQNIKFLWHAVELDTKTHISNYRMLKERRAIYARKDKDLRSGKAMVKTGNDQTYVYIHGGTGTTIIMPTCLFHVVNFSTYRKLTGGISVDDNKPFDIENTMRYEPGVLQYEKSEV